MGDSGSDRSFLRHRNSVVRCRAFENPKFLIPNWDGRPLWCRGRGDGSGLGLESSEWDAFQAARRIDTSAALELRMRWWLFVTFYPNHPYPPLPSPPPTLPSRSPPSSPPLSPPPPLPSCPLSRPTSPLVCFRRPCINPRGAGPSLPLCCLGSLHCCRCCCCPGRHHCCHHCCYHCCYHRC